MNVKPICNANIWPTLSINFGTWSIHFDCKPVQYLVFSLSLSLPIRADDWKSIKSANNRDMVHWMPASLAFHHILSIQIQFQMVDTSMLCFYTDTEMLSVCSSNSLIYVMESIAVRWRFEQLQVDDVQYEMECGKRTISQIPIFCSSIRNDCVINISFVLFCFLHFDDNVSSNCDTLRYAYCFPGSVLIAMNLNPYINFFW